jgi:cardiolipin synthase
MRTPYLVLTIVIGVVLAGCRSDSGNGNGDDADAGVDAPDGVGCTALSPRTVAPEAFAGPTGLQARLTTLIDSAQATLDVQMYLFTVRALADRIVAAKARGVAVRVILDPDEAGNAAVMPTLASGQVPVRNATPLYPYAHAKYLVIDGKTGVIMSMNFNVDAMSKERNYGIVDKDPEDVADLRAIFEMDWAAAGNETAKPADLTCTRLVVAPNNARQRILELVASAQSTLEVEALYVSETTVRNAIGAAKARGVDVRVILEDANDQPDNASTLMYFDTLAIPVHYVTTQFYLHAKLIIADGVAFVGSENFSISGLTKNREVGAIVFEPASAAVMIQQFDSDWAATPAAP